LDHDLGALGCTVHAVWIDTALEDISIIKHLQLGLQRLSWILYSFP